jgi:hypothetical protein
MANACCVTLLTLALMGIALNYVPGSNMRSIILSAVEVDVEDLCILFEVIRNAMARYIARNTNNPTKRL